MRAYFTTHVASGYIFSGLGWVKMEADDVSLFPRRTMVAPHPYAVASQHNSRAAAVSTSRCTQAIGPSHSLLYQQLEAPQSSTSRASRVSQLNERVAVTASLCSLSRRQAPIRLSGGLGASRAARPPITPASWRVKRDARHRTRATREHHSAASSRQTGSSLSAGL